MFPDVVKDDETGSKAGSKAGSTTAAFHNRDHHDADGTEVVMRVSEHGAEGNLSRLCVHCQYTCDNLSRYQTVKELKFTHWDDIYQLEKSAATGCTTCAQLLKSGSSDGIRALKEIMKNHRNTRYRSSWCLWNHSMEQGSDIWTQELKFWNHNHMIFMLYVSLIRNDLRCKHSSLFCL